MIFLKIKFILYERIQLTKFLIVFFSLFFVNLTTYQNLKKHSWFTVEKNILYTLIQLHCIDTLGLKICICSLLYLPCSEFYLIFKSPPFSFSFPFTEDSYLNMFFLLIKSIYWQISKSGKRHSSIRRDIWYLEFSIHWNSLWNIREKIKLSVGFHWLISWLLLIGHISNYQLISFYMLLFLLNTSWKFHPQLNNHHLTLK